MFDTYALNLSQAVLALSLSLAASPSARRGPSGTIDLFGTVRWLRKTAVFVCSYLSPPKLPRIRLNRLERPSLRISHCLGDQVTQDSSPRPRAPGPPSPSRLLNEQSVERKLHRLLSGVISALAGWTHRQRINRPLKLSLICLGITVESRSTGYQPKTKGLGCRLRLALPLTRTGRSP